MGIRSFLGFASGDSGGSSSGTGSTGTRTTTSGSGRSGGWHTYDEATARRDHRTAQAPVQEAATDRWGRRVPSVSPYTGPNADATRRNFGRRYRTEES
ncbi:hypothetical protein [Kitasatospora sp. NPDC004272]